MQSTARYGAHAVRDELLARGGPVESGVVRYVYRPFDNRWLYWEAETRLLGEKSPRYPSQVFKGNIWIEARKKEPGVDFCRGALARHLADNFGNGFSSFFPAWLRGDDVAIDTPDGRRPNLSPTAAAYLDALGLGVEDLFHHVLAVLHDPAYRVANAGALRMEWPRIPLPAWPDGDRDGAAEELAASAARGRELARLLDPDTPVPGVTAAPLRPDLAAIAVPATADGGNMTAADFALTAGWGHFGAGGAVMPGQGRLVERAAPSGADPGLGATTFDIYLNGRAYWRNVPAAVWHYKLGGYQVLKKWLSYRDRDILGRPLGVEEVQYFTHTARRIAAILGLVAEG